MAVFVFNHADLGGRVQRVTRKGREYLVVHATMINPGVLNGSMGALHYPPEVCSQNVSAWDGIPLTVYHPTHPTTNEPVSAKAHGVWTRQGIGRTRNSRFDGKLRTTAWFDVQRTKDADQRLGTDIYNRLVNGQPIELSTGLFTSNVPARPGETYNGRAYDQVVVGMKPDHLAILHDQVGACSIRDGCGVGVVNAKSPPRPPIKQPPCPPGGT